MIYTWMKMFVLRRGSNPGWTEIAPSQFDLEHGLFRGRRTPPWL
jgi:hypothetical protein